LHEDLRHGFSFPTMRAKMELNEHF